MRKGEEGKGEKGKEDEGKGEKEKNDLRNFEYEMKITLQSYFFDLPF